MTLHVVPQGGDVRTWLECLDDLMAQWLSASEQIVEALKGITDDMAREAGYASVHDLLSTRYAGKVLETEWKALRDLGFSQSATAALTGTTTRTIVGREERQRANDHSIPEREEEDHLQPHVSTSNDVVQSEDGPTCEPFNHFASLAHELLRFIQMHEEQAPWAAQPKHIKAIHSRLTRVTKIMKEVYPK